MPAFTVLVDINSVVAVWFIITAAAGADFSRPRRLRCQLLRGSWRPGWSSNRWRWVQETTC